MSLGGVRGFDPARMREAQAKAGLSGRALAQAMGMSATSVFTWMTGSILPDAHSLKSLADALGCTTTYLAPLPDRPMLGHYRERSGRTQAEMGAVLGVAGWFVSRVEHGLRWPDDYAAWAVAYGVSPRTFRRVWGNAHDPTPPAGARSQ